MKNIVARATAKTTVVKNQFQGEIVLEGNGSDRLEMTYLHTPPENEEQAKEIDLQIFIGEKTVTLKDVLSVELIDTLTEREKVIVHQTFPTILRAIAIAEQAIARSSRLEITRDWKDSGKIKEDEYLLIFEKV